MAKSYEKYDLSSLGMTARVPVDQLTHEELMSYASQIPSLYVMDSDGKCDFSQYKPNVRKSNHKAWARYCRDCFLQLRSQQVAAAEA